MAVRFPGRTCRPEVSQYQSGRTGSGRTRWDSTGTRPRRPNRLPQVQAWTMCGEERIERAGNSNVINPLRSVNGLMLLPALAGRKHLPACRAPDQGRLWQRRNKQASYLPARGRHNRRARFRRSASKPDSPRRSSVRRGSPARNHASAPGRALRRRIPCTRAPCWRCRP